MAATGFGAAAVVMGVIGIIGTVSHGYKGQMHRAEETEKCAILWFILGAVLLR